MTVRVQLTISGLCMFVPDEGDDDVLHVLMPSHDAAAGMHVHPGHGARPDSTGHTEHHTRLIYPRSCEVGASEQAPLDALRCIDLDECALEITHIDGGTARPSVHPRCVPELDARANFLGVDPECVRRPGPGGPGLDPRVRTRLTLRGVGAPVAYTGNARCLVRPGQECGSDDALPAQFMAQHVRWDLGESNVDTVPLHKILVGMKGARTPELDGRVLHSAAGVVELRIVYAIPFVLDRLCSGKGLGPGTAADDHFPMYYQLSPPPPSGSPYMTQVADPGGKGMLPGDVCNPALARFAPPR